MELATLALHREIPPVAAVAAGLGDPSITLVENGPALGLLLADSCHQDSYTERLFLDQVTWVRGDEAVRTVRHFPEVCLRRNERDVWMAEDCATGRLFPRPSRLPYQVLFLSEAEHRNLAEWRQLGNALAIFTFARMRFGGLPGFHRHDDRLVSPAGYADAEALVGAGAPLRARIQSQPA